MFYTSSKWHYFEKEDLYLALIRGELYQSVPRDDGSLRPEFWQVDWAQLDERPAERLRAIAKELERLSYCNEHWYPYEEHGSYYQLERGILRQCPMNIDDTRDDSPCEVIWAGVEAEHKPRLRQIVAELRQLP